METPPSLPAPEIHQSRFGRFIQNYSGFLSSFVIGAAGLIATSIWQFRQSEIASRQAEAQQRVAQMQAENSWKIERADILSKNLQVLSQGSGNIDQRYGVLLSLTRGEIMDPELAVSYALEMGKDNAEYMRSVLANTSGKDYWRLSRAFAPTCEQRYGVARNIEICKDDKMAARSAAVANLFADDLQAAFALGKPGPLAMLKDEREVQRDATRMTWLFSPALTYLYERHQWEDITRFEAVSPGAHLVAALVLSAARTGELVGDDEAQRLKAFHAEYTQWLADYLLGHNCDSNCRAGLVDILLSAYLEAQADYDGPMLTLLQLPPAQSGAAVARLHSRLLWCQVEADDLAPFRDRVLVPLVTSLLDDSKAKGPMLSNAVSLVSLVDPPVEPDPLAAWKAMLAKLDKTPGGYGKSFVEHRALAARERQSPPPAMRRVTFCNAPEMPSTDPAQAR